MLMQHLGPVLTTYGTTFRPAGLAVDVTARQTAKRLRDYANEHIYRPLRARLFLLHCTTYITPVRYSKIKQVRL